MMMRGGVVAVCFGIIDIIWSVEGTGVLIPRETMLITEWPFRNSKFPEKKCGVRSMSCVNTDKTGGNLQAFFIAVAQMPCE
jgi:hypothetical protein